MEISTQSSNKSFNKDKVIYFPGGLVGFESLKEFRVFNSETENDLYWLRSDENETIEFAVTKPHVFLIDYEITLDDIESESIGLTEKSETIVLITISKDQQENKATRLHGNFLAPLIINLDTSKGLHKILNNENILIKSN